MCRDSDRSGQIIDWSVLVDNLKDQELVPFLGAGASLGFNGSDGLPTASELAESLAQACHYPGYDTSDLLRVTQYYAGAKGELKLRKLVHKKLSPPRVRPSEVHKILASWPIKAVLTTNYDNLMEDAFRNKDKKPFVDLYDRRGDQQPIKIEPSVDTPLIYKLHGSLDDIDTMVLTEDDTIDFLISLIKGNPGVPSKIRSLFETCSILFIGYGLKDWNIRVLLRYLRENEADIRSFAIQRLENVSPVMWERMVFYWNKKNISIYNCDALEFLQQVDCRYRGVPCP